MEEASCFKRKLSHALQPSLHPKNTQVANRFARLPKRHASSGVLRALLLAWADAVDLAPLYSLE